MPPLLFLSMPNYTDRLRQLAVLAQDWSNDELASTAIPGSMDGAMVLASFASVNERASTFTVFVGPKL